MFLGHCVISTTGAVWHAECAKHHRRANTTRPGGGLRSDHVNGEFAEAISIWCAIHVSMALALWFRREAKHRQV